MGLNFKSHPFNTVDGRNQAPVAIYIYIYRYTYETPLQMEDNPCPFLEVEFSLDFPQRCRCRNLKRRNSAENPVVPVELEKSAMFTSVFGDISTGDWRCISTGAGFSSSTV